MSKTFGHRIPAMKTMKGGGKIAVLSNKPAARKWAKKLKTKEARRLNREIAAREIEQMRLDMLEDAEERYYDILEAEYYAKRFYGV